MNDKYLFMQPEIIFALWYAFIYSMVSYCGKKNYSIDGLIDNFFAWIETNKNM